MPQTLIHGRVPPWSVRELGLLLQGLGSRVGKYLHALHWMWKLPQQLTWIDVQNVNTTCNTVNHMVDGEVYFLITLSFWLLLNPQIFTVRTQFEFPRARSWSCVVDWIICARSTNFLNPKNPTEMASHDGFLRKLPSLFEQSTNPYGIWRFPQSCYCGPLQKHRPSPPLCKHKQNVMVLAISPASTQKTFLVTSVDRTVQLWDVHSPMAALFERLRVAKVTCAESTWWRMVWPSELAVTMELPFFASVLTTTRLPFFVG